VGVHAIACEVDGQFIVSKGSTARREGSASWDSYVNLRESLVNDGKQVVKDDDFYEFASDVEFPSPSAGAAVAIAGNRNGRITWKLQDSWTYADWKQDLLEHADAQ
jgi:hypothetical protein